MEPEIIYHSRHDVTEKARTFRLTGTGVAIDADEGQSVELPYAGIRQVRLRFSPSRFQTNRFECLIVTPGREFKIGNEFFRGIARFEDRSGDYRRFVTALCRRVAAAKPTVEFIAGRAGWILALEFGFLVLMAFFLGCVLWLTGAPLLGLIWVKLGVIVFFLPALFRYFKRNRPTRFDPRAIPAQILPASPPLPVQSPP